MLLTIRANRDYHLGFPADDDPEKCLEGDCQRQHYIFSPNIVCEKGEEERADGTIVISLSRGCMNVLKCLKDEKDWNVLSYVLAGLPGTLQNKVMALKFQCTMRINIKVEHKMLVSTFLNDVANLHA